LALVVGWVDFQEGALLQEFCKVEIYADTGVVALAVCWVEDESIVNKLKKC
jgi:hypothetical protein